MLRDSELPERDVLMARLAAILGEDLCTFEKIVLHFLGQRVEAEVFLPAQTALNDSLISTLNTRLAERLPADQWFSNITLNCVIAPK